MQPGPGFLRPISRATTPDPSRIEGAMNEQQVACG